jgi:hypothetical protein
MIQSIIFNKKYGWTIPNASKWIIDHGYKLMKIHETKDSIRIRQEVPSKNVNYRTIKLGENTGVSFVVEYLK